MPARKPYDPLTHPAQARLVCSQAGFNLGLLAQLFGVSTSTLRSWRREHPELEVAIVEGQDAFNCGGAEKALLKLVLGFEHVEVKQVFERGELVERVETQKYYPPNVKAVMWFLANRSKDRWNFNLQKTTDDLSDDLRQLGERLTKALRERADEPKLKRVK